MQTEDHWQEHACGETGPVSIWKLIIIPHPTEHPEVPDSDDIAI